MRARMPGIGGALPEDVGAAEWGSGTFFRSWGGGRSVAWVTDGRDLMDDVFEAPRSRVGLAAPWFEATEAGLAGNG